jgi:hypothetical protein
MENLITEKCLVLVSAKCRKSQDRHHDEKFASGKRKTRRVEVLVRLLNSRETDEIMRIIQLKIFERLSLAESLMKTFFPPPP